MTSTMRPKLQETISHSWFQLIHRNNLVYNTCWEDPRLDHQALSLGPEDRVLVITSAGCNALDYALADPRQVLAVDINPLQNALLELKQVAIRELDHATFFQLFGRGRLADWDDVYEEVLRPSLSIASRVCWDRRGDFFRSRTANRSFYFRGSSGWFAWLINRYIDRVAKVRPAVEALLHSSSIEEQRELFERHRLADTLWSPLIRWLLRRDTSLAMLGVPRAQRRQLDDTYPGGIAQFIIDRVTDVFTRIPLQDNYFWRVYLTGEYTRGCCPAYLSRQGFQQLKSGLVNRVTAQTGTVLECLREYRGTFSRFVLLDHMDWLWSCAPSVLAAEWSEIFNHAEPGARVIWRSAGSDARFIHDLPLAGGGAVRVGDRLEYQRDLAERLHSLDRVNTYGSLWIADIVTE